MSLAPGTRLGPYEVREAIGAGGMGEVYRARDTRLDRDVAIKVLPAEFVQHPDRLRRFELEARAVSALNHANILTIFDIGEQNGLPYVVYELLEGETLRDAGRIPRRAALDYARQIARGLAAAHDKGITHRDLKPENLFITRDGRAKILDFGLAKVAVAEDAATVSGRTQPGSVLGTAGYMSPEQVRGEEVDHRSDIFSFGSVLYEMLSGERAFKADTAASTMHAILTSDPPELDKAALDKVVRHCLEKSATMRFQSARDIDFALDAASTVSATPPVAESRAPGMLVVVAALLVAAAAGYLLLARATPNPMWRGTILPGPSLSSEPRVSPDGRTLAFTTHVDRQIQVAVVNPQTGNWTVLTKDHSQGNAETLSWSADGNTIYFSRLLDYPRGIYSIPSLGGEERLVLENASRPEVLPDGSLLLTRINAQRQHQMYRFWPSNGRLDAFPVATEDDSVFYIRAFPDGRDAVFYGHPLGDQADSTMHLYAMDLTSKRLRRLDAAVELKPPFLAIDRTHNAVIVMVKSGDLFQIASLNRSGDGAPRPLFTTTLALLHGDAAPDGSFFLDQFEPGMEVLRFPSSGGAPEQLPGSGLSHVVARPMHPLLLADGRTLVTIPFAGRQRLIAAAAEKYPQPLVQTEDETSMPAVALPGGQLAFVLGSRAEQMIAIASLADGRIVRRLPETAARGRFIARPGFESLAASPDGATLYYSVDGTVWSVAASGGQPVRIAAGDSALLSPDGSRLLIKLNESEPRLVWMAVKGGEPAPIPLQFPVAGRLSHHTLSPGAIAKDGRILATVSTLDHFFFQVAIVDPVSGKVSPVSLQFPGDVIFPAWSDDGKIVAVGRTVRASIWHFQQASLGL